MTWAAWAGTFLAGAGAGGVTVAALLVKLLHSDGVTR